MLSTLTTIKRQSYYYRVVLKENLTPVYPHDQRSGNSLMKLTLRII